tara:strand:- start:52 stop:621 length:570 start_codon:yes stop_codon:yes gene_type:complete
MAKQDFWLNPNFEPKRQFRFLVQLSLGPDGGQDVTFLAKSVDRPSYTISDNPHQFFNHTFYYPGRVTWNTISLTLVDPVSPNGAELLYQYLETAGVQKPTSIDAATGTTITKSSATAAMGRMVIQEIATPTGGGNESQIVGQWELLNPFFTDVNFGSHDYGSEEMIDIAITVRYDWAEYVGGIVGPVVP